jgi:enoyl-CoA hydratase/carnithine racemase
MSEALIIDPKGAVVRLLLNRPSKRNALNHALWQALWQALQALAHDERCKLLVLSSSTPGVFCAGADIGEFASHGANPEWRAHNQAAIAGVQLLLARFPKPTIAQISGPCIGGGCGLALACDFRIADETASFGITPAKLGLVYSLHDTKLLVDLVGPAHAKSILFTGRVLDAAEALRIGLITHKVSQEALEHTTQDFAQSIIGVSQHSVRAAKQVIQMIQDGVAAESDQTRALFDQAFEGADHQEGVAAFLAKRAPSFPSTR